MNNNYNRDYFLLGVILGIPLGLLIITITEYLIK